MAQDYESIGGIKPEEMERLRKLRGLIQTECVSKSISVKDAMLWAVNNELDRRTANESE